MKIKPIFEGYLLKIQVNFRDRHRARFQKKIQNDDVYTNICKAFLSFSISLGDGSSFQIFPELTIEEFCWTICHFYSVEVLFGTIFIVREEKINSFNCFALVSICAWF